MVTLIDQSPHQLHKAKKKKALKGVKIMEGDAEDLPFPPDTFDRYVSAGRLIYSSSTSCFLYLLIPSMIDN